MKRISTALLVGAALAAACSGGDSDTSSAPVTAEVSTPLTTSSASTTAPPDASAVPVCPDVPATVEGIPSLTGDVMLVDELGSVMRVEVATGEVTCVRPYESDVEPAPWVQGDPAGVLRLFSTSLISTGGVASEAWFVPDDPTAQVEAVDWRPISFWGTDYPETLWAFRPDVGEVWLAGYLTTGFLDGTISLDSGERAIAADGRGGLVIESGDSTPRVYRTLSTEGATEPLWIGSDLVTVGADTIVGVSCESQDACKLTVTNRMDGDVRDLGVAPAAFVSGGDFLEQFVTLSPDENLLATPTMEGELSSATSSEDGPMVINVTNGSVVALDGGVWPMSSRNLTWSADGSVLYWIDTDGGLRAWSPTDPDTVMQIGADVLPVLRNVVVDD